MNAEMQPIARELAIGIAVAGSRHETDLIGRIYVPADRYHGAQTQCSFIQFSIGDDRMPKRVCHAYGYVKNAVLLVNAADDRLPHWKAETIARATDVILMAAGSIWIMAGLDENMTPPLGLINLHMQH